jgi:diacylglycerol kinase (ATP)
VQRCAHEAAGTGATLAIIPAGTANLFATNLGIPTDIEGAVAVALDGHRRKLDLGTINGEHFAVMAGVGFDADMIADADRGAKQRLGRLAYVRAGLRHVRGSLTPVRIEVDGTPWFRGEASCVLLGNVGRITGGIPAFDDARPDDGWLEVGVATAGGTLQWARTLGRMALGRSDESPFVRITRARKVDVRLAAPTRYELDGGDRGEVRRVKARVVPAAITICVPGDREPAAASA